LKYAISDSTALQIEPIALTAEGFVEEWIALPWWSASDWSNPKNGTSLGDWHAQLHGKDGGQPFFGDLPFRQTCSPDRKLIQISFPADYPPTGPKSEDILFLVREVGPHLFRMVNIGRSSADGCSKPVADETQGERLLPESMNRAKDVLVRSH
jgi:hypothetical protein